jgi:hypothetical protein
MFKVLFNRYWHLPLSIFIVFVAIFIMDIIYQEKNAPIDYEVGKRHYITVEMEISPEEYIPWETEVRAFSYMLEHAYGINSEQSVKYSEWILLTNLYTGAPELFLAGLIMTESTFRDNVKSSSGAIGPGQIKPSIWGDFCNKNVYNPYENVECSGLIIMHYYEKCSADWICAFKNYNVGPGNLKKNTAYYRGAGQRYTRKIDNHVKMLVNASLEINNEFKFFESHDISLFEE